MSTTLQPCRPEGGNRALPVCDWRCRDCGYRIQWIDGDESAVLVYANLIIEADIADPPRLQPLRDLRTAVLVGGRQDKELTGNVHQ